MATYRIPFNRACLAGNEQRYILQAVAEAPISGDGVFTKHCSTLLENELGVPRVMLTTSCTDALEMSAILLNLQPGDEVIVPSFTFVSSVNAFVLRGANPVFADVRPDTLNLDESKLEDLITERTCAIVPVHYAGVGCEMDAIQEIAQRHDVAIVEDNAHGLFGRYKGRLLGTFGQMATQSFHETKNFTCGEGGAILINDPALIERAEIIREKGTNRSRFFRGEVDKYTWVDIGSSYLPSDVLAAFLYAQLEGWRQVQDKRCQIWNNYQDRLDGWAQHFDIRLPIIPPYCEQSYHMYYMLLPSLEVRQALIEHLRQQSVLAVFHYLPLHDSPMGRSFGAQSSDCPVTMNIADRLLRLPFYNDLNEAQQDFVVTEIKRFFQ